MIPQRNYRLGTASNNNWAGGRGVGVWGKLVLRGPNLHPHVPPRFTHFS